MDIDIVTVVAPSVHLLCAHIFRPVHLVNCIVNDDLDRAVANVLL